MSSYSPYILSVATGSDDAILSPELPLSINPLRAAITDAWLRDESALVRELTDYARLPDHDQESTRVRATHLIRRVRSHAKRRGTIEAFMRQYDLSSEEGVLLLCVAESLLRIPDQATVDKLIRDKLGDAEWEKHLGESSSVLVNASTWGLMMSRNLMRIRASGPEASSRAVKLLATKMGESVVRKAISQAMRIMSQQFVMGGDIEEGLAQREKKYRYSFDMLGEAAMTRYDAHRNMLAYCRAVRAIGQTGPFSDVLAAPGISIKLSTLFPRYEHAQRGRVLDELIPVVINLAQLTKSFGICCTIDAEEAERLELSLEVFEAIFLDPSLSEWEGLGLVVQAYQKRALPVIDWVADLARRGRKRIPIRLVKGSYWDTEIKRAQIKGLAGYPVFTRKQNTDISYLACIRRLFEHSDALYPKFATHNAQTIASIPSYARGRPYELQKLRGMGDDLYNEVMGSKHWNTHCRIYAPIGPHNELLPYLVRRLLENGANTSFVNLVRNRTVPIEDLVRNPIDAAPGFESIPHPRIPLPMDLYRRQGIDRKNSMGVNLANDQQLLALAAMTNAHVRHSDVTPLVPGTNTITEQITVTNPANLRQIVGHWRPASPSTIERALDNACLAQRNWDNTPVEERAAILEHGADLLEQRLPEFLSLCIREGGKTIADSIAEVREAVDYLRYYAMQARQWFGREQLLAGPTGESNKLQLQGRGVFVCISPWNYPLSTLVGQVAAALVTGNTVIAKPSEKTTLTAFAAISLLREAGIPAKVLQMVPGTGATVGMALIEDSRVAGVVFTGSSETARIVNRTLAARDAAIGVLIAETDGQNALIADSTALPEQLVKDAISSTFSSAGQRRSAARVLFVQEEIADAVIELLAGTMAELKIGDPGLLSTDIGPLISPDACKALQAHADRMAEYANWICTTPLETELATQGNFFAPRAYELQSMMQLPKEVFGPILHVIRWKSEHLDQVIDSINESGYGLTLGIHSRIDATIEHIVARANVGNIYVNREQVGAVVGVQPFGGRGLSGTGPKTGGPYYLPRFACEKTITINTAAAGGNASLLTLDDDD